jgi:neutral trehalase
MCLIFSHPGGRFREQYYWDSFWIVEGLIASELSNIVNSTLQNFMDEIETIGFIPNGGRIYCMIRCLSCQLYADLPRRLEPFSASDVHTGD